MAEGTRNRERPWGWWLSVLAVAALVLAGLLTSRHGPRRQPAAGPSTAPRPPSSPTGPGNDRPSAGSQPKRPAAPGGGATPHAVSVTATKTSARSTSASRAAPRSARTTPVTCQTNLPLSRSPNAPYNFLCTQAGRPLTWPNGMINLYVGRLSTAQRLALPVALHQWEAEGHFTVTQVSSPAAANATITPTPLSNQEAGYTQVHYSCNSAGCFYDRATVTLSSTEKLAQTAWVSTICHELGHAAGLNHVSRHPQVMYPSINDVSPDAYTPGDIQGLQAEYQQRSKSSAATRADATFGEWIDIS